MVGANVRQQSIMLISLFFCFFSLAAAAFSPHLFFAVTVAAATDSSLLPPQQPLAGRQYSSVQYSTSVATGPGDQSKLKVD